MGCGKEQEPQLLFVLVQEYQKELSQWRKDPSGGKKKPKYSYKTVEELKAKGRINKQLSTPQKELSQVKVRLLIQDVASLGSSLSTVAL